LRLADFNLDHLAMLVQREDGRLVIL